MTMLSDAAKTLLLAAARASIQSAFGQPSAETKPTSELNDPRAAFVSLHSRVSHALRGCIGTFAFDTALLNVVQRMAREAAFEDPRFPPLEAHELPLMKLEISALTKPTPIASNAVEVGKHGLLISRGHNRGVLLPQVPVEWQWNREEFLAQTCQKAGLPPNAWRQPGTQLFGFEAEVFSEP